MKPLKPPPDFDAAHLRTDLPVGWKQQAACRGMPIDLFFPTHRWIDPQIAATCQRCPVQTACNTYAAACGMHGWWGGTRRNVHTPPVSDDELNLEVLT